MTSCPTCSTNVRLGARYCLSCGSKLVWGPVPTLKAGTALNQGRYIVNRLLGCGGMGAVYLAKDQQLGIRRAIKQMVSSFLRPEDRGEATQQFRREAAMLQSLYHVGIPEFYDHFAQGDSHYIVMEYIEGRNLLEVLESNNGPLAEADVVRYVMQICDVLSYLHSHQPDPIIYRDLKPANVILEQGGRRVVLTDFGIARFFAPASGTGTRIGTPGYAPKEQYAGRVEPRSDLYALAATMHHLLTNRDPQQHTPFEFPRVRTLNPQVSPWLDEIIDINLRDEPSERYDSASHLKADMQTQTVTWTTRCRSCGHVNPHGKAYCDQCTRPLSTVTIRCSRCGMTNALNSNFCISCGARL